MAGQSQLVFTNYLPVNPNLTIEDRGQNDMLTLHKLATTITLFATSISITQATELLPPDVQTVS